jgi:hypothetical protein
MSRGSAPGEHRGGRKPGVPNKATADIKALARPYGPSAVAALAQLAGLTKARGAANEQTRVMALRELLDRGYGRATTVLAGDSEAPPVTAIQFTWAPAQPAQQPAPVATTIDASPQPLSLVWQSDDC